MDYRRLNDNLNLQIYKINGILYYKACIENFNTSELKVSKKSFENKETEDSRQNKRNIQFSNKRNK